MIRKFIYFLLSLTVLTGCNNIQQVNQVDYCRSELNAFTKQVFDDMDDVNIYSEFSDGNIDMQSIRIYMKTNNPKGNDVTIGWLNIDKNNNKIYNITDNENVILNNFNEKRVKNFINACVD